jgi:hypothetical protein
MVSPKKAAAAFDPGAGFQRFRGSFVTENVNCNPFGARLLRVREMRAHAQEPRKSRQIRLVILVIPFATSRRNAQRGG